MTTSKQLEFRRQLIHAVTRLWKLDSIIVLIGEQVQFNGCIEDWAIDHFYDRWYSFEDALTRLKATSTWQCADFEDEVTDPGVD